MSESSPPGEAGFATKSDLVYTRVRDLILSGDLAPGAVLPQAALARAIGMSTRPSGTQLESHRRFHAAVHRASHNTLLVELLDGLWVKTDRYRLHGLEAGGSDEERAARATEHRLLFGAIRDGDPETAAELMRRHVEDSLRARSAGRPADPDAGPERPR